MKIVAKKKIRNTKYTLSSLKSGVESVSTITLYMNVNP
jgi:hypothetical protein